MRKRQKIFLLLAGVLGIVLFLSIALYFSAARLLNSEAVKEKIYAHVIEKTGAVVRYGASELHFFPLPAIIFHGVDIAIPDEAHGSIESLIVYPGLWPLLRGNLQIAKLGLEAPRFTIPIFTEKEKPPLDVIERKLRALVSYVVTNAPGLAVTVRDGRLDLTEADEAVFSFSKIRSRLGASHKKLEIDLTSRSNLWDNLSFSASLGADDLKGEGTVRLTRFRPDILAARLSKQKAVRTEVSDADLSVTFSSLGLRQVQASVESAFSGLTVMRGGKQAKLKNAEIKGGVEIDQKKVSVHITEATVGHPALALSGHYLLDRDSGGMTVDVEGKSMSVQPLRASALTFAGDIPTIRTIFDYLRDGRVPNLHFHTAGRSLADLGRTENIRVSGKLSGGTIYVAVRDLLFQNVTGDVDISRGLLEGSNVSASLMDHRCSRGSLQIGLKGEDAPFHIDLQVKADAGELPALIRNKRLVTNEAFLREMGRLYDLRGTAEGRLLLGDRLDSIRVKIAVNDMNITARYEPVPFPLSVTGGKFLFDEKGLNVSDLNGSIGNSSFSRLTGSLMLDSPYNLEINSGQMRISADEIYPWLTSFEEIKPVLNTVRSVKGVFAFSSVTFRGPLYEPKGWQFTESGELMGAALDASFLPGTAEEMTGSFRVTQNELSLKDVRAKVLDSRIAVTGSFTEFPSDISAIDLSLRGDVGPEVLPWITALSKLPPEIKVRAPFSVTDAAVSWRRDRKTAFDGRLIFGKDTKVSLVITNTPDALIIHNIAAKDSTSDASAEMVLKNETIDAAFRGKVTSRTLNTILIDSIFSDTALEGDFKSHIVVKEPPRSTAEGSLRGDNIPMPRVRGIPVVLRHISLEAEKQGIAVNAAELSAGEMTFRARGKTSRLPSWFAVDMDLSSDGIDLNTIEDIVRQETSEGGRKKTGFLKDFPVRGTMRVTSDFLRYSKFTLRPFNADVTFDGESLLLKVKKAALCEISATGEISINEQGIKVDTVLSAKNLAFRPTILCLTDKNADYTGTFDMEANLKGEGTIKELANRLNGTFNLHAKDGKILKSRSINKTLDLLNESENFKGEFPDAEKEILSYRVLNARGTLQGQILNIEEGILDASIMGIMARGSVDLDNETLDLNALVAPLKTVHRLVRKIPILGYILGGNLVSVPVKISGNMKDPQVTFLSPSAIGSEFLGILERTIKLPVTLIEPIFPKKEGN